MPLPFAPILFPVSWSERESPPLGTRVEFFFFFRSFYPEDAVVCSVSCNFEVSNLNTEYVPVGVSLLSTVRVSSNGVPVKNQFGGDIPV
jgi:hypothetical protein